MFLWLKHIMYADMSRESLLFRSCLKTCFICYFFFPKSESISNQHIFQWNSASSQCCWWKQTSTKRHVDSSSIWKANFCRLCFHRPLHECCDTVRVSETRTTPMEMDQTLTHQRAEGDDGQESLDQDAEPVRQSSVIAAVGIRLVDVGHVCDFKRSTVQESFHQDATVTVHVHVDKIKTTALRDKRTTSLIGEEGLYLLEKNKPPDFLHPGIESK